MKKTVSLVLAVLLLSMLFGISYVYSEGTGSLTIKYTRKDNGQGIAGVEMSVFKVANLSGTSYVLTEAFDGSGILVNDLSTADKKNRAAAVLFAYASEKGISGTKTETDVHGNANFSRLTHGIYLVAQTKAVSGFKTIPPYLVYIPGKTIGGSPIYNVLSNVTNPNKSFKINKYTYYYDSLSYNAYNPWPRVFEVKVDTNLGNIVYK